MSHTARGETAIENSASPIHGPGVAITLRLCRSRRTQAAAAINKTDVDSLAYMLAAAKRPSATHHPVRRVSVARHKASATPAHNGICATSWLNSGVGQLK